MSCVDQQWVSYLHCEDNPTSVQWVDRCTMLKNRMHLGIDIWTDSSFLTAKLYSIMLSVCKKEFLVLSLWESQHIDMQQGLHKSPYLVIVRQHKLVLHAVKVIWLRKEQEFLKHWMQRLFWKAVPLHYDNFRRCESILILKIRIQLLSVLKIYIHVCFWWHILLTSY